MTREDAIQVLQTALTAPFIYGEYADALNMAIEALQKEAERQEMIIRASERYLGIVRCKDCKHHNGSLCDIYLQSRMETDFCNHGERLCNHDWRKGGDLE